MINKQEFLEKGTDILEKAQSFKRQLDRWVKYYDSLDSDDEIDKLIETDKDFIKLADGMDKVREEITELL